jgi:AcrR family transcriptional regulator
MSSVHVATTRDDMRSRIVEAAAQLLAEHGARAVTTRAVARAAGVQAPTIYRLFGDKDGLIDAVAEHVMATYVATKSVAAAAPDVDPVEELRSGWRAQVEFGLANPELYALLSTPGHNDGSPATAAGIEVLRARIRRLATAGLLRVDEYRALAMVHAAGTGTVLALLDTPTDERDAGLSDAVLDAVLAGILTTVPAAPDTTVRTVAVTFASVLSDLPALTDAERALMAEWLTRSITRLQNT